MLIINNFSFILAILAFIFGFNWFCSKSKKDQRNTSYYWDGSQQSVYCYCISNSSNVPKSLKELGKNVEETVSSVSSSMNHLKKEREDAKFNWTKEQFDALQVGDIVNYGAGGTNYDDVASVHGRT